MSRDFVAESQNRLLRICFSHNFMVRRADYSLAKTGIVLDHTLAAAGFFSAQVGIKTPIISDFSADGRKVSNHPAAG